MPDAQTPATTMMIAGRTFSKATTTTLDQDAYVMQRMRAFGLVDMANSFDVDKDDMTAFGERLLLAAFESGQLYEILGGTLVEEGVKWTRDVARANAVFFSQITDPKDKQAIYGNIASIILDFLLVADAWSKGSQKSSSAGSSTNSPNAAPSGSSTDSGAPLSSTSESGIGSPAT